MLEKATQVSVLDGEESFVTAMLQQETRFFSENFERLLERYLGKLVLIKGSRLVGVFETQRAAVSEGTRMFGSEPFLVRRMGGESRELCFRVPFGAALPEVCACARCSRRQTPALFQTYA
jgi:hypothetical protein